MQIELIGCTGAGKSTLIQRICQSCQAQARVALLGDDFVLGWAHLGWIQPYLLRRLLVDLLALLACVVHWRKHSELWQLSRRLIAQLPDEVGWYTRLKTMRNVLRNLGVYELIQRYAPPEQVILLDEGTVHIAHYLFAQPSGAPGGQDLERFGKLVPLPDLVIYLRQDTALLVQRTLARGHWRLQTGGSAAVEHFITTARTTFERLVQLPSIARKLIVVQGQPEGLAIAPGSGAATAHWFLPILGSSIAAVNAAYQPSNLPPTVLKRAGVEVGWSNTYRSSQP